MIYLLYFFTGLWSESFLIFSPEGLFPSIHPWLKLNPLLYLKHPWEFQVFLTALLLCSVGLISKYFRVCALILWLGWMCLISRIPFYIPPPNIGYIGFFLLVLTQVKPQQNNYTLPTWFHHGLWIILGLSYSASGLGKIYSPSWQSGEALITTLQASFSQDGWLSWMFIQSPGWLSKGLTYFVLLAELLFLPLVLFIPLRKYALAFMSLTHVGIVLLLNIDDIPLGLLTVHLFFIEEFWFKPSASISGTFNGTSKIINFLKQENKFSSLSFNPSDLGCSLELNQVKYKGWLACVVALSYTNGFWFFLRPFKYIRKKYA